MQKQGEIAKQNESISTFKNILSRYFLSHDIFITVELHFYMKDSISH